MYGILDRLDAIYERMCGAPERGLLPVTNAPMLDCLQSLVDENDANRKFMKELNDG